MRSLADLAGKSIGVSAPGSATHTTTRAALRKAGVADKDMKFVHHGALPEIFVSLDKGLVDAGVASAPRPAFRELVDLATQRIPFLQGAIIVNRGYLQRERPVVVNFLKGFVEAMKLVRGKAGSGDRVADQASAHTSGYRAQRLSVVRQCLGGSAVR